MINAILMQQGYWKCIDRFLILRLMGTDQSITILKIEKNDWCIYENKNKMTLFDNYL